MVEYQFPLEQLSTFSARTIPLHLLLSLLTALPIVLLFAQAKRLAKPRDGYCLLAVMVSSIPIIAALVRLSPSTATPFLLLWLAIVETVCLAALVATLSRLKRNEQAVPVLKVIAALVVLGGFIGLMLPAVPSAREAARRMQCSNNVKQMGLALANYESRFGVYPAGAGLSTEGVPVSWRVLMLPFMEGQSQFQSYNQAASWDSEENLPLAWQDRFAIQCPSNPFPLDERGLVRTAYARAHGANTVFKMNAPTSMSEILAGTSNAIAFGEACGANIVWTEPRDTVLTEESLGINLPGETPNTSRAVLSGYHGGGANVSMVDGSVQFLSENMDREVLRRLLEGQEADPEYVQ